MHMESIFKGSCRSNLQEGDESSGVNVPTASYHFRDAKQGRILIREDENEYIVKHH